MQSIRSFLLRMGLLRFVPAKSPIFIFGALVLVNSATSWARLGVDYQMALGNPTAATTDSSKTNNYLIVRSQYAMSYNGITHQANWVSWSYSSSDSGSTGRTDAWSEEAALPAGYYRVGISSFGSSFGESWDRGHMCPSADRTLTVTDNQLTFRMSNIIPQAAQNNQGLWGNFENYTRSLATDGDEILIISGPAQFTGNRLFNQMAVPGSVWKIVVEVPGTPTNIPAASRITTNSRVIALLTPNTASGVSQKTWQNFITSVEEIEAVTGFRFFSNVDPSVATYLKNIVDTGNGQPATKPTVITGFSPVSGPAGTTVTLSGYNFGASPAVEFNGVAAPVVGVSGGSMITVTVPAGAGSGPITVTGTGGTDTSAADFTVATGTEPTLGVSPVSLTTLSSIQGAAGTSQSYTVNGSNLTGAITVTAPANFEVSLDNTSFAETQTISPNSGSISRTLYVRIQSAAILGSVSGTVTHSGGGATTQNLSVSGTVVSNQPSLTLSTASLSGFSALQGSPSTSKSYTVSGVNLSGAVTVTPPSGYEISTNNSTFVTTSISLTPSGTTLGATTLYARIHSSAPVGTVSGQITHSGGGATSQNLPVSGTVTAYAPGQAADVYWNFTTDTPTSGAPAGVTVSAVSQGNNNGTTTMLTTTSASSGYVGASGGNNAGAAARIGSLVTAANGSAYFEFTLTPSANVTFALTAISFGSRSTGTGPQAFTLRSSANGYASDIATGTMSANSTWAFQAISGLAFSSATPTTFRIYGYNGAGSATVGTANWRIDDLNVTISAQVPVVIPVITSTNAATATNYAAFSYQILTASNNTLSYNASGLPSGLSVNTTNGLISGTPAVTPGTYTVGLSAINSAGEGTQNLTLTLLRNPGAPTITSSTNATAYLRSAFSFTATASPAATSFSFTGLPGGLTNSGATISGTATSEGTFNVGITAANSLGSDAQNLVLTVLDPVITLSTNSVAGLSSIFGKEGSVQSYTVSGANLTSSVTVSAPADFQISEDNANFTNTLSLPPSAGSLDNKMLFVRLATNAPVGAKSGTVAHTGGGAISRNVSVAGTVIQPQLSISGNSLSGFNTRVGVASASQSYTISGTELTGGITVTAPLGFELSTDNTIFSGSLLLIPAAGTLSSQTIYVRVGSVASEGALTGSITHVGGDAISQNLGLTGTVVQPRITLSASSLLAFNANLGSASAAQTYTVSGSNLTGSITVSAPAGFEVSLDGSSYSSSRTLVPVAGTLGIQTLLVRLSSSAPLGPSAGTITHSGGDAAQQGVEVSGMVISATPVLSLSTSSLSGFSALAGTIGASQSYTISGSRLTNNVVVSAPTGYELSLDESIYATSLTLSPSAGAIHNLPIFVRLASSASPGPLEGAILHTSEGAQSVSLTVSGTVTAATPVLTLSTATLTGFSATAGTPGASQTYQVSGVYLKGPITLTPPSSFELSQDGTNFATNLTLVPSGGALSNVPVKIRISSLASTGNVSGAVLHAGGGASNQTLSVSGQVSSPAAPPAIISTLSGAVYTNSSFSYTILLATNTNSTNTTYTFSASNLPAGFTVNASTGLISGTSTNVSRTNLIQLFASSTQGVATATYRLRTMTAAEQTNLPLSVVINKYHNATVDRIELLVTGDDVEGPPVDMRGMVIKDYNSNMGSDQGGKYVFNPISLWSRVKAGTLIVLSAGTSSAEDLDPSDFVLRVNLGNSACFTTAAGGFDIGNTEMVMIKTADAGVDGVAGGIHALAGGSPGTQYNNFKGSKMVNTQGLNGGSRTMVGAFNSNATLADFYSSSGAGTANNLVFGSPNSTGNTNFINALRAKDQDGPVITVAGTSPITIAHGSSYTDAGASATDAVNGSRTVLTNNPVNPSAVGAYTVTYTASDVAGNVGTATRIVNVIDQTPPLITLLGSSTVQVPYGTSFSDPGASATDAVDGNLTSYIQVFRPIQTASVGSYTLQYVVTDFSGNSSETLSRTVQVTKATPSITAVPTASAITAGQSLGSSTLSGGTATVPGIFAWSSPSTVPGSTGSYEVRFTPTDSANYNTATTMVSVTVNANPLTGWAGVYGLSGSNAGPNADPDGDGFSNAQEYAFGLNPSVAGGEPAALSQGPSEVKITFLQKESGGISYAVKSATSLSGGFTNTVTPQLSANQGGAPSGYQRYEATIPTTSGRGFLKVEATIP